LGWTLLEVRTVLVSVPLPLLMVLLLVAWVVAVAIGANDETMASVVGAKALTLNGAILLGGCLQIIGAQLLGRGVSETIGEDLVFTPFPIDVVLVLMLAMAAWLILASYRGYPISTTHSIVGCVLGVGLALEFTTMTPVIRWDTMAEILAGWILSPVFGLIMAFLLQLLVRRIVLPRATGMEAVQRLERGFAVLLVAMVVITGLSRGGNDVSKAVGVLVMVFPDMTIPLLIGGVGMAVGLFILGRRVVKTVGMEVTELRPSTGFSVEASVATVLFIGTLMGIPLSGTHVLIAAVMGVGLANRSPLNRSAMKEIALSSLLTVPVSALIAVGFLWVYLTLRVLLFPM